MQYTLKKETQPSMESVTLALLGTTILGLAIATIWKANKPLTKLQKCLDRLKAARLYTQEINKRISKYEIEAYKSGFLLNYINKCMNVFKQLHKFKPENILKTDPSELCKIINNSIDMSDPDYASVAEDGSIEYKRYQKIWILERATCKDLRYDHASTTAIVEAMIEFYRALGETSKLGREYNLFMTSKTYLEMNATDMKKINKAKYAIFTFLSDMHKNMKPRITDVSTICSKIKSIQGWHNLKQDDTSARTGSSNPEDNATAEDAFDYLDVDFDEYLDAVSNASPDRKKSLVAVNTVKDIEKWFKEFIKYAKFIINLRQPTKQEDSATYCKAIDKELAALNLQYLSKQLKASNMDENNLSCETIGFDPIDGNPPKVQLLNSGWLAHASVKNLFKLHSIASSYSYTLDDMWNDNENAKTLRDKLQAYLACSVYEYFGEALDSPDLHTMIYKVIDALTE